MFGKYKRFSFLGSNSQFLKLPKRDCRLHFREQSGYLYSSKKFAQRFLVRVITSFCLFVFFRKKGLNYLHLFFSFDTRFFMQVAIVCSIQNIIFVVFVVFIIFESYKYMYSQYINLSPESIPYTSSAVPKMSLMENALKVLLKLI